MKYRRIIPGIRVRLNATYITSLGNVYSSGSKGYVGKVLPFRRIATDEWMVWVWLDEGVKEGGWLPAPLLTRIL